MYVDFGSTFASGWYYHEYTLINSPAVGMFENQDKWADIFKYNLFLLLLFQQLNEAEGGPLLGH